MSARSPRIPTTKVRQSFAVPICSACKGRMQRDDSGLKWFCLNCADDWLRSYAEAKTRDKSIGGVALPSGVSDPRRVVPSFKDLMPNRAARRRLAKAGRRGT